MSRDPFNSLVPFAKYLAENERMMLKIADAYRPFTESIALSKTQFDSRISSISSGSDSWKAMQTAVAKILQGSNVALLTSGYARTLLDISSPWLDIYEAERLAFAKIATAGLAARGADQDEAWAGVTAIQAELEDCAAGAPLVVPELLFRLMVWAVAATIFAKLVTDGYAKGGMDEATINAAALWGIFQNAWSFYMSTPEAREPPPR
jgi:hypothetical protein